MLICGRVLDPEAGMTLTCLRYGLPSLVCSHPDLNLGSGSSFNSVIRSPISASFCSQVGNGGLTVSRSGLTSVYGPS